MAVKQELTAVGAHVLPAPDPGAPMPKHSPVLAPDGSLVSIPGSIAQGNGGAHHGPSGMFSVPLVGSGLHAALYGSRFRFSWGTGGNSDSVVQV